MSDEQNTEARPTAQPISPMQHLEQRHIDAASASINAKISEYRAMGTDWNEAQIVFLASVACLGQALADRDRLAAEVERLSEVDAVRIWSGDGHADLVVSRDDGRLSLGGLATAMTVNRYGDDWELRHDDEGSLGAAGSKKGAVSLGARWLRNYGRGGVS